MNERIIKGLKAIAILDYDIAGIKINAGDVITVDRITCGNDTNFILYIDGSDITIDMIEFYKHFKYDIPSLYQKIRMNQ